MFFNITWIGFQNCRVHSAYFYTCDKSAFIQQIVKQIVSILEVLEYGHQRDLVQNCCVQPYSKDERQLGRPVRNWEIGLYRYSYQSQNELLLSKIVSWSVVLLSVFFGGFHHAEITHVYESSKSWNFLQNFSFQYT